MRRILNSFSLRIYTSEHSHPRVLFIHSLIHYLLNIIFENIHQSTPTYEYYSFIYSFIIHFSLFIENIHPNTPTHEYYSFIYSFIIHYLLRIYIRALPPMGTIHSFIHSLFINYYSLRIYILTLPHTGTIHSSIHLLFIIY